MEIKGNFKAFLTESIKTKDGDKTKGTLVLDIPDDKYPTIIAFDIWKEDLINQAANLRVGQELEVLFNVKSREYNGKYFTSAGAWRIDAGETVADSPPAGSTKPSEEPIDDDLPF